MNRADVIQTFTEDFHELVGDDDGVFGCMTLLGCHDVRPKQLPLQTQIAFLAPQDGGAGLAPAFAGRLAATSGGGGP